MHSQARRALCVMVAAALSLAGLSVLAAPVAVASERPPRIVHTDPAERFGRPARPVRAASGQVSAQDGPLCSSAHERAFQMIYARPSNVASRLASIQNTLLADAEAAAQRVVDESAAAPVRPRFLCGITDVQTAQTANSYGPDPLFAIVGDLQSLGYNRSDRKYLIWWDGDPHPSACGEGTFADDERPSPAQNWNNIGPDYAFVYKHVSVGNDFCGWTTALHEMGHTLGAVMKNSPHHTANWHCTDENDILCYADGAGVVTTSTCPGDFARFDCNKDDYFNPSPPGGSYLANNWNTYNSSWLEPTGGAPPPPPPPPPPPVAPETTITTGPTGTVNEAGATFEFVSSIENSTFRCSLDGGPATTCQTPVTYSGLADGQHLFSVFAVDPSSVADPTPAERSWTVDLPPGAPDTSIGSAPAAAVATTTASFSFTATISGSTFECSLDGAPATSCSSPVSVGPVLEGAHTFSVVARSPGGLVDPTPATHAWRVDVTAPTVAMTQPTGLFSYVRNVALSWAGEDVGSLRYKIRYRAAKATGGFGAHVLWREQTSASATFIGAAGTTYCLSVQATDDAGNASAFSAERCIAIALDDRSGWVNGFSRNFGGSFYLGTVSVARKSGSRMTLSNLRARNLSFQVQMCAACRYVEAYWNGRLLKKMSLYTANARVVTVGLATFSSVQTGTLTFVVRSPVIVIDGIGVSAV